MDELLLMAKRRRSDRVEPVMRGRTAGRGELNIGLDEGDRAGGTVRGGKRRTAAGGGKGKRGRAKRPKRGLFRRLFRGFLILFIVGFVMAGAAVAYYASKLPSITTWEVPERPPNISILAADGTVIANRGDTGGQAVTIQELPDYLPQAIVAMEDHRFYSHLGVDPLSLGRVVYQAIVSDDRITGASTITQQLARTLFLTLDRTAERKIQEAILAVWLEIQYSKDDILEMYLNRVYFGAGTGVDAAARRYFGKPASQVTLGEAAMLAGILPAPSRYAPTVNPEAARTRQRLVLNAMVEHGYITQREADLAAAGEIATSGARIPTSGSYLADWVADLVPAFLGTVRGDIIVDTTIDMNLQAAAATAVENTLAAEGETFNVGQAAMVAMTPDGAVVAMVGGRDYAESQYNRAVSARRQPGSSFKPFVYLAALEHGLRPETIRIDQPINIDGWRPENYGEQYVGPVSLQRALALSLNTISVQLADEVGPAVVVATARRMGITSPLQALPSIALGTSEVSLLELTGAYAPFANGGNAVLPFVIRRITSQNGQVLYQRSGSGLGQVVDIQYVGMMNSMLHETLETGTGRRAAIDGWSAAGKTGTSQDFRDAWFIGYTSHLVAGIWLGNDDNSPTARTTGGSLPAGIWNEFMTVAHEGATPAELPGAYLFRNADVFAPPPQTITEVINGNGGAVPAPPPGAVVAPPVGGPIDRYNPQYDPRYDPTVPAGTVPPAAVIGGQPMPPAPVGGASGPTTMPPAQVGNGVLPPAPGAMPPGQVIQPQPAERPGLLRRLFGF